MFYVLISHIFYSSRNHCLVFSHDENNEGYQNCDNKYGDISNNTYEDCYSSSNTTPWYNNRYSISSIKIEDTIKPKNIQCYFQELWTCGSVIGLSNIDTSNCTSFKHLFQNLGGWGSVDISEINSWDVSKVTNFQQCFNGCSIKNNNLDLSNWDTKVGTNFSFMFQNCKCSQLNISNFNTQKASTMQQMFHNTYLTSISYGTNFVKASGCNITNMFKDCSANKPSWW